VELLDDMFALTAEKTVMRLDLLMFVLLAGRGGTIGHHREANDPVASSCIFRCPATGRREILKLIHLPNSMNQLESPMANTRDAEFETFCDLLNVISDALLIVCLCLVLRIGSEFSDTTYRSENHHENNLRVHIFIVEPG